MIWTVGYCANTKEWSEGGTLEDYPAPHWDVYRVEATNRDSARRAAQRVRRITKAKERRIKQRGEAP